ncbi:hypothetical protein EDB83DRAFT_2578637 [Lactarius deliciosus]|nr:hypothetical protein EDB83DRAFT_2578637 [Lactarius deliciosus]
MPPRKSRQPQPRDHLGRFLRPSHSMENTDPPAKPPAQSTSHTQATSPARSATRATSPVRSATLATPAQTATRATSPAHPTARALSPTHSASDQASDHSISPTRSTARARDRIYTHLGFDRPRSPSPPQLPLLSQKEFNARVEELLSQGLPQEEFNTRVRVLLARTRLPGEVAPAPRPSKTAPLISSSAYRYTPALSRSRAVSPSGHRARFNTTSFPSFPATTMSHSAPSGLAAMPAARSQRAPHFSGQGR